MSCNRSPPNSPRAPKIQQQSWDDCGTPPIDLYDPQENSQSLRNQPKSPNSPRKPNKPINVGYYEPRSPSISTRMNNQRSPKYDNSPRSPKITTTYANDDTTATQKSFYQSPRRSPKSPRKFVFDAISPSYEQKGRKFEYYEPTSPDDDGDLDISYHSPQQHPLQQLQVDQQFQNKHSISTSLKSRPYDLKTLSNAKLPNRTSKEFSGVEINEINEVHQYNEHLNINDFPGGIQSLYIKRDSCVTESTQISGDSCETNATILTTTTTFISSTIESSHSEAVGKSGNSAITGNAAHSIPGNNETNSILNCVPGKNNGNGSPALTDKYTGRGRRHAINITSNPGYQVLHSSHSTLDRTCSDSIVSLRCRKSTSDLTDVNDGNTHAPPKKPRRRGSSKGGLAYLASRRSSRESIKSACSNTSIFSNEDIGPLAFQSSTRGRQRRTSNFLELPVPDHVRPRVCSLPDRPYNPRFSDDLYRLRHFSISKGTVVNCGDSIISRRSRSNTSVNSTTSRASERSPFDGSCCGGGYANVDSMPASPTPTDSDEPPPPPRYRVVMLGEASVGKTALVSQFMTSEYMHTYDASLDDEFGEKTVSVLLDDEESELVFIDHPSVEMSVENSLSTYEPHSCVIVYSIVDRNSFRVAEEIINYLWRENVTKEKAVILVGNKADLARSRMITTQEGKTLAASRDAKFIETSSGIQHNVDELLVGVLKQMRLKEKRDKKAALVSSKMKNSKTHMSLHLAKEILQKICLSDITKSKSCENLHVL